MKNAFPFHLSLPCTSIGRTKDFYLNVIGAQLGRNTTQWLDINLFGNQITYTKSGEFNFMSKPYKLEDHVLPSFHFGVIVDRKTWDMLHSKISAVMNESITAVTFLTGNKGEHTSFFVTDPNGHTLEFKTFLKNKETFAQ